MAISSANHAVGYVIPWIILAMVVFSYYAYVVSTCIQYLIQTKSRIGQATPYIVFYHIFLVMAVWSYIRVVFTDPGRPPKADASREGAARKEGAEAAPSAVPIQLPLHYACDELGRPRWCDHCKVIKPNRTHHDSESGRCVTKMDHFCPWICNTVGARNHKFFLQFCIYALVFVAYVFATTLPVVIELTNAYTLPANINTAPSIILTALAAFFALILPGFVFIHIRFALLNRTTIENLDGPRGGFPFHVTFDESMAPSSGWGIARTKNGENPWDLGSKSANWKSLMGEKPIDWILPVKLPPEDGLHYVIRPDILERMKNDARKYDRMSRIGPGGVVYSYNQEEDQHVNGHPNHISIPIQETNASLQAANIPQTPVL